MRHVLPEDAFADWFARFLPRLADPEPATLFVPATITDRSDGKLAHLDGLNLKPRVVSAHARTRSAGR